MNKIDKIENLNEKKEKTRRLPKIIGIRESLSEAIMREIEEEEATR